jgi:hypothetical protein
MCIDAIDPVDTGGPQLAVLSNHTEESDMPDSVRGFSLGAAGWIFLEWFRKEGAHRISANFRNAAKRPEVDDSNRDQHTGGIPWFDRNPVDGVAIAIERISAKFTGRFSFDRRDLTGAAIDAPKPSAKFSLVNADNELRRRIERCDDQFRRDFVR